MAAKAGQRLASRGVWGQRAAKLWRDWRGLVFFVAIMLVFRSAVADWNQVPSGSMKPGILDGDRIVVDKLAWGLRLPFTDTRLARWSAPARGDVVTFENPLDGRLFVKPRPRPEGLAGGQDKCIKSADRADSP